MYYLQKKYKAHKGMLSSAKYIKKELEDYGVLDKAFAMHPDYSLVLAGNCFYTLLFCIVAWMLIGTSKKIRIINIAI